MTWFPIWDFFFFPTDPFIIFYLSLTDCQEVRGGAVADDVCHWSDSWSGRSILDIMSSPPHSNAAWNPTYRLERLLVVQPELSWAEPTCLWRQCVIVLGWCSQFRFGVNDSATCTVSAVFTVPKMRWLTLLARLGSDDTDCFCPTSSSWACLWISLYTSSPISSSLWLEIVSFTSLWESLKLE